MSVRQFQAPAAAVDDGRGIDLDILFRLYAHDLISFAHRRLRDREAAADVVHDGFLRGLGWQARRAAPASLADTRNVLWRIVSNLIIDSIRRKRVRGDLAPLARPPASLVPLAPLLAQAQAQFGAGAVGFIRVDNPGRAA